MKRGEERKLHIRRIRDAAMSVITKLGEPVVVQNISGRPVEASIEGFSIFHLTPFQKTPGPSDRVGAPHSMLPMRVRRGEHLTLMALMSGRNPVSFKAALLRHGRA